MMTFLYILLAIVVLLFMILVHELGHYIAGKILKFKITEFSIGFGKAIFSHTSKKTGERFSLRIFPLGGYCSFYGEEDEGEKNDPQAFNSQKPWKRIIVFLAGVTMNFITAIIFSWILLCAVGYDTPQIVAYSDTINVGVFQESDVVRSVAGTKIDFAFGDTFSDAVTEQKTLAKEFYESEEYVDGTEYTFTMVVTRDGENVEIEVAIIPYEITKTGDGSETSTYITYVIGLETDLVGEVCTVAYKYGFFEGLGRAFSMAFGFAWVVLKSLWALITFQIPITEVGGTISTIATMAEYSQQNIANMLIFIPLISANLAVFNLLPFPALDGAHVVFTLIEWIRRKPINRKVENTIHFVGICILFAFVVIVDIIHFVV